MNLRRLAALTIVFCTFELRAHGFTCEELLAKKFTRITATQLTDDAETKLLANIAPAGTLPGTVIASPSRSNPDYYYMWIRDAALTMEVVTDRQLMLNFVDLSLHQQQTYSLSGLGEPKFNVDGTSYTGPWGRPQNDGPALRAIAAIQFAQTLLREGKQDYVRTKLYNAPLPTLTLIKTDLEYIAHNWQAKNFDLWEEVFGRHFYTLLAQKKALNMGGDLADQLGDGGAANFYHTQARAIDATLNEFWSDSRGYFYGTLDQTGGPDHSSGLDVAVILAALHSTQGAENFGVTDDRILATAFKLQQSFAGIYKVNQIAEFKDLGTAIGRYPEDHYTGYESNENTHANPWFLATNAYAELYYRASRQFSKNGEIVITDLNKAFFGSLRGMNGVAITPGQTFKSGSSTFNLIIKSLIDDGDRFIARVRFHASSGHLSEQFDRETGQITGAYDLTWSYASLITALRARP